MGTQSIRLSQALYKPGMSPRDITQYAISLVGEATPSCFQSFITILFVVQQMKFFGG